MKRLLGAVAVAGLTASLALAQAAKVDSSIAAYQKVSGVSGNINSVGSDTMNNMMALWGETFQKLYPNVKIANDVGACAPFHCPCLGCIGWSRPSWSLTRTPGPIASDAGCRVAR